MYPFIDKERCINCNLCNTICPIINHTEWDDAIIKSYVGYSTNEEIRLKSSSGGIFSVLAEYILKSGNVSGSSPDIVKSLHAGRRAAGLT